MLLKFVLIEKRNHFYTKWSLRHYIQDPNFLNNFPRCHILMKTLSRWHSDPKEARDHNRVPHVLQNSQNVVNGKTPFLPHPTHVCFLSEGTPEQLTCRAEAENPQKMPNGFFQMNRQFLKLSQKYFLKNAYLPLGWRRGISFHPLILGSLHHKIKSFVGVVKRKHK